jgi:F-type H+-transporting ATPase subunit delta
MSIAASRYARALLDVLYPATAESGLEQLKKFSAVLAQQPAARVVFESPMISPDRRKDLLNKLGDSLGFDMPIRNFLALLIERNRLNILGEIVSAYETLLDEKLGIVRASVSSAMELDPAQHKQVAATLQTLTGKKVRMEVSVDPGLIGGLVAQVGSTIYDGSVRSQLETFRSSLLEH